MLITRKESYVVGISAITTNAAEMAGGDGAKIPGLWQSFLAENIAAQIPNRVSQPGTPHTAVLYTDIETDETGPYRIIIGALVKDLGAIPEGMTGRAVPAGDFEAITSRRGPLVEVTVEAWQKIWADSALKQRRSYAGDLELYDERSADPHNAELDILIGVK
ncbi:MAG: effector binding domain-containing protein [Leptospirales bacterium]|jgi:predicted transcriptional regulator YdeE